MTPKELKQIRKTNRLSRKKLAELLGYSSQSIWLWETGRQRIPYAVKTTMSNRVIKKVKE